MKELIFNVKFMSDIVLPASSNTEGKIEQLDFIPGSNFLGMAAREYGEYRDSFHLFHSGNVRFGDATLLIEGKATYKMPLSFFHEKLDVDTMVNHHLIDDFSQFRQLKQKRKGYITRDLDEIVLDYNYAQKSAYDKDKRRSKEGSMYGYESLPKGTVWQFVVSHEGLDPDDLERLKKNLTGHKRLGKSKSSQYGQVYIQEAPKAEGMVSHATREGDTILYAKSRIALLDHEGHPTFHPKYLLDDLDETNIVWDKSQIRTSTYAPYHGAMQTKSYTRMVINSGSVIVLKDVSPEQIERLKNGVGIYRNEGFGELLINPDFLQKSGIFSLKQIAKRLDQDAVPITDNAVRFLHKREMQKREKLDLASAVHEFITHNRDLYRTINKAQWGTIRAICTGASENFREEIRDYISSGTAKWQREQIAPLLDEGKSREFIKLLAIQMPKEKGDH